MAALPHHHFTRVRLAHGTMAGFNIIFACVAAGCSIPMAGHLLSTHQPPAIKHTASFWGKPTGVPVRPKGLHFLQAGFHNCGSVAMLMSWAKLYPRGAAGLVWKQSGGGYVVRFPAVAPVTVTQQDLQQARLARLVSASAGDSWALVALTAFAKIKDPGGHPDFHALEWIDPREIGFCLAGQYGDIFKVKEESTGADGRLQMGPPISLDSLDEKLRAVRGHPAAASTNRRIHIWAIFDYDPVHRLVYIRNPRCPSAEWMPLGQFRDQFELVVYLKPSTPVPA